eukprot:14877070-Alexandrium_andersonii.AAC.1
MSASLVGSEMCIRDRCSQTARGPQASWAHGCARGWLARPAALPLVAARSWGPDVAVDELLVPE